MELSKEMKRAPYRNKEVYTSLRRALHGAQREAEDLLVCPFLDSKELDNLGNVYNQICFSLSLL